MEPLEVWVHAALLDCLDGDEFRAKLAANTGQTQDAAIAEQELRDAIKQDRQRLNDVDGQHTDGDLDDARWRGQIARLSERIEKHESQLAEVVARATRSNAPDADSVRRGWQQRQENNRANNASKRAVLSMFVDHIVVKPYPAGMPLTLTAAAVSWTTT